uniref:Uncharacterized protein n=1 Tax=Solanum tuberosum TaxID=4113 RepID=M1DT61_SOLTU
MAESASPILSPVWTTKSTGGLVKFGEINWDESGMPPRKRARGIVINEGANASNKKGKKPPLNGGKDKGKAPVAEIPEHNSGSDGESFESQDAFSEPEDDQPL